jgi:hypothetical protein
MKFAKFTALLAYLCLVPVSLIGVTSLVLLSPQNQANAVILFRTSSLDKSINAEALLVSHLLLKGRARIIQPSALR